MCYREDFFEVRDGLRLYRRSWGQAKRAVIVLLHGFAEHTGRYRFLVQSLNDGGYAVEAMDCRGHGRSGGIRGHVNRFEQYLEDLDQFLLRVQSEYAVDIPIFLLGHSQGGHIILRYGIENPKQSLAGMIVSSPYLGLTARIPRAMLVAAHLMSKIWPTFSQTPPIEKAHLTHDPEIIEETRRDPLYLHSVTARWYIETLRSQVETMRRAGDFQFPLLMQQAGDDLLVDQESASNFFERIGSQHKRRIEYPDYFHEIYNETADRRCSVFVDLHNWLDQQIQNHVR